MSERNSPSIHIHLFRVDSQLANAIHVHRSERLVDLITQISCEKEGRGSAASLKEIDILLGDTNVLQNHRDGVCGTNAHDARSKA
jgi:hypothetical protein